MPRIVKKVKTHLGRKKLSIKQIDPNIRKHWDEKRTVAENFKHIGLTLDMNPSLKSSKQGKVTMIDA